MKQVTVRNLGVGSLIIGAGEKRILVDAYNTLTEPVRVIPGDIILFTHDDGDHFCAEQLPVITGMDVTILGPPSIVKPILMEKKADIQQIQVMYTNRYDKPACMMVNQVEITCFHTSHFNHWDPIHNSYLLEVEGKRIVVTGDSLMTTELSELIGETDVIICNLVDEVYLKTGKDEKAALQRCLQYISKVGTEGNTRKVIGIHLLGISWTVDEKELCSMAVKAGYDNVIVPTDSMQVVDI